MIIQLLDNAKKKKIVNETKELGVTKIRELLIKTGKNRIRAYSGNLSTEEIMNLWRILPIESVGLYIAREDIDKSGVRSVRLTLDALHNYKDSINDKTITLTSEQETEWFQGKNIELNKVQIENLEKKSGFFAIKSFDGLDFIGTAKLSNNTLYSFLPKERTRKTGTI